MNIKRITIFLSLLLLISCMCFPVSAQDEYDSEEADSLLIWGYSCRHALFDDAAPDRPITISPRLWYMGHKEPKATYRVEIVFEGFMYITKDALEEIRETYAKQSGYASWEDWFSEYSGELDAVNQANSYIAQQKLLWHIEHNQTLIDQYMRAEDAYEWVVYPLSSNLVCELSWERILELALAGDGKTVFIEYDREALTGGISVFPEAMVPIEGTTNIETESVDITATEMLTTQLVATETDDTLTSEILQTQDCTTSAKGGVCFSCVIVFMFFRKKNNRKKALS